MWVPGIAVTRVEDVEWRMRAAVVSITTEALKECRGSWCRLQDGDVRNAGDGVGGKAEWW